MKKSHDARRVRVASSFRKKRLGERAARDPTCRRRALLSSRKDVALASQNGHASHGEE